ncbi:hypothetical protein ACIP4W_04090 [Streptomyces sp. NPDC088846]|uniref:hypothetical protein n=1 Tax=Streptomyces sp. NPDC088846 TaxID=3365908 RepID=UPI00382A488E
MPESIEINNTLDGGTQFGGVVQAGTVDAVHFHFPHYAPPTPWQVRPTPPVFTDRADDLAALLQWLRQQPPFAVSVVAIHGEAGVGKSTLASRLMQQLRERFPGGQLYADLYGHTPHGPAPIAGVLASLIRSVHQGPLPASAEELSAWWRSVSAAHPDRPLAMLLDNATRADQIRDLLPGGQGHLVIATSRQALPGLDLDGALLHHLRPFGPAASREYLARRIGAQRVAREPQAARAITARAAGIPLALAVAASDLATQPDRPLSEASTGIPDTRQGDAVTDALAHAYQRLPDTSAAVYRRLGALFTADTDAALTAAACHLSPDQAEDALRTLHTAGLLESASAITHPIRGQVYLVHDAAKTHATSLGTEEEQSEAVLRALDYYLGTVTAAEQILTPAHRKLARDYLYPPQHSPITTKTAASSWLSAQHTNVMAALRTAAETRRHQTTWQLCHALWCHFHLNPDHGAWLEAHALGYAAAVACEDRLAQREIVTTWGIGLRGDGQHDEAIHRFNLALALAREDGDALSESQALYEIGATCHAAGRGAEGRPYLRQARTIRVAENYSRGVALADIIIALTLDSEQHAEAIKLLSSARAVLLAENDFFDAARALLWLARAHAHAGDWATAERYGCQAVIEFTAEGSPRWIAYGVELLGLTAQEQGQLDKARDSYKRAVAIYQHVSHRDDERVRGRLLALG